MNKLIVSIIVLAFAFLPINAFSAVEFNSTTSSVDTPNSARLDGLGPLTFSAWIYPRSEGEGAASRVYTKGVFTDGTGFHALHFPVGTNRLRFVKDGTTDVQRQASDNSVTLDKWQHVLVTWNGSTTASNIHIYVNGNETTYAASTNGVTLNADSGTDFFIGTDSGGANTFDGYIAEAALWNVVLTVEEIRKLAFGVRYTPLSVRPSALLQYFPMNECAEAHSCTGTGKVRDYSIYMNHATPSAALGRSDQVSYP